MPSDVLILHLCNARMKIERTPKDPSSSYRSSKMAIKLNRKPDEMSEYTHLLRNTNISGVYKSSSNHFLHLHVAARDP